MPRLTEDQGKAKKAALKRYNAASASYPSLVEEALKLRAAVNEPAKLLARIQNNLEIQQRNSEFIKARAELSGESQEKQDYLAKQNAVQADQYQKLLGQQQEVTKEAEAKAAEAEAIAEAALQTFVEAAENLVHVKDQNVKMDQAKSAKADYELNIEFLKFTSTKEQLTNKSEILKKFIKSLKGLVDGQITRVEHSGGDDKKLQEVLKITKQVLEKARELFNSIKKVQEATPGTAEELAAQQTEIEKLSAQLNKLFEAADTFNTHMPNILQDKGSEGLVAELRNASNALNTETVFDHGAGAGAGSAPSAGAGAPAGGESAADPVEALKEKEEAAIAGCKAKVGEFNKAVEAYEDELAKAKEAQAKDPSNLELTQEIINLRQEFLNTVRATAEAINAIENLPEDKVVEIKAAVNGWVDSLESSIAQEQAAVAEADTTESEADTTEAEVEAEKQSTDAPSAGASAGGESAADPVEAARLEAVILMAKNDISAAIEKSFTVENIMLGKAHAVQEYRDSLRTIAAELKTKASEFSGGLQKTIISKAANIAREACFKDQEIIKAYPEIEDLVKKAEVAAQVAAHAEELVAQVFESAKAEVAISEAKAKAVQAEVIAEAKGKDLEMALGREQAAERQVAEASKAKDEMKRSTSEKVAEFQAMVDNYERITLKIDSEEAAEARGDSNGTTRVELEKELLGVLENITKLASDFTGIEIGNQDELKAKLPEIQKKLLKPFEEATADLERAQGLLKEAREESDTAQQALVLAKQALADALVTVKLFKTEGDGYVPVVEGDSDTDDDDDDGQGPGPGAGAGAVADDGVKPVDEGTFVTPDIEAAHEGEIKDQDILFHRVGGLEYPHDTQAGAGGGASGAGGVVLEEGPYVIRGEGGPQPYSAPDAGEDGLGSYTAEDELEEEEQEVEESVVEAMDPSVSTEDPEPMGDTNTPDVF